MSGILAERLSFWLYAESAGQNGASQKQPGESVTRDDRRRRELEARKLVAAARPAAAGKRAPWEGDRCSIVWRIGGVVMV